MASTQQLLKRIAQSTPTKGSAYIRDGRGRLLVERMRVENNRSGEAFIADLYVEFSEAIPVDPNQLRPEEKSAPQPNPAGSTVGFYCVLDQKDHPGPGNAKAFCAAVAGVSDEDVSPKDFLEALSGFECEDRGGELYITDRPITVNSARVPGMVSDDQPCRGFAVDYETRRVQTKKGEWIVIPKFRPVKLNSEQIELNKRRLEERSYRTEQPASLTEAMKATPAAPMGGLLQAALAGRK